MQENQMAPSQSHLILAREGGGVRSKGPGTRVLEEVEAKSGPCRKGCGEVGEGSQSAGTKPG